MDDKGERSSIQVNVPGATTFTNVVEFAVELFPLIDALIMGQIIGFSVTAEEIFSSGVKTSPVAGADVEEGARFGFMTAGGHPTSVRLATFDEAHMVAGSALVDQADADVIAFVTAMTGGIDLTGGLPVVSPSDTRDEDITTLSYAKDAFQASR